MENTSAVEQISFSVYQTIVVVQQQKPDWLTEKYRNFSFQNMQSTFTAKLTAILSDTENTNSLLSKLLQFLKTLFLPDFFKARIFNELKGQVELLLPQVSELRNSSSNTPVHIANDLIQETGAEAIAILLVDAENIKLTSEVESFLQSVSQFPIQVKIAFANWRNSNMSKRDLELHKRGYQMIHVPAGKNSADLQMTAVGASVFMQYPNAKEVIVCSSDSDLNHLCNMLRTRNLTVYSAVKRDKLLVVSNCTTGKAHTHFPLRPNVDSRSTLEQEIVRILQNLIRQPERPCVPISVLSVQFKHLHGRSITETMQDLDLGSKYLKFLQTCHELKLHQINDAWQVSLW